MKQKKIPLSLQIFLALGLGIAVGMAFTGNPTFAVSYIKPFGTIFLNLLKFVVVPIVFFSILSGIISMSDIRKVGSMGKGDPSILCVVSITRMGGKDKSLL